MADQVERPMVVRDTPPEPARRSAEHIALATKRSAARRMLRSRRRMSLVLAYTAMGHTNRQIAAEMGLSVETVRDYQGRARREGHLDDVVAKMDRIAVPEAVDGLIEALQNRERWAIEATLEGRGVLASGGKGGNQAMLTGPPPPLQVNIVLAPGVPQDDPRLKPIPGNIVGVPRLPGVKPDDDDKT